MDTIIAAVAAFGGVLLGAWITGRQQQAQRRADFLEHQLRDFYSPLLSLRDQILAKSQLREKILSVARKDSRIEGDQFARLIQHDTDHFVQEIFPDYQTMLTILRNNYWLAKAETRSYFSAFFEFVEIWNRWLNRTIPAEVVSVVGHSEESLQPFYEHLRSEHDELQTRLSRGEA